MSRLFVFGIGGTGSRVIRSLIMLLASGVKIDAEKVIPIIIDPDTQNGDMLRTVESLNIYQYIYGLLKNRNKGFFNSNIATLRSLRPDDDTNIGNTFHLDFANTLGMKFKSFIDYHNISSTETKWFLNLLFSQKNLDDQLTMGFLGNPNVGSVVLNKLKDTEEFNFFGKVFEPNDRIFIISSIFGGTGAAGFPLLLKNLRDPNNKLTNVQAINDSIIGAVTVLPYFKIDSNENCAVDSGTFITKSKAALSYYSTNINNLNALYYIGDDLSFAQNYKANDGGKNQENKAHLVELAAAISIIDFMSKNNTELLNQRKFFEFSVEGNNLDPIDLTKLCYETRQLMAQELTQFFFFSVMNRDHIKDKNLDQVWAKRSNFDNKFLKDSFYCKLTDFFEKHFNVWLGELNTNERPFSPFNLSTGANNFSDSVNNKTVSNSSIFNFFSKFDFGEFDKKLNTAEVTENTIEKKFMEIWWEATKTIVQSKYNFK